MLLNYTHMIVKKKKMNLRTNFEIVINAIAYLWIISRYNVHLKKPKFIGAEQQIIKVIPGSRTNKIAHRIKSEALLYSLNKSK